MKRRAPLAGGERVELDPVAAAVLREDFFYVGELRAGIAASSKPASERCISMNPVHTMCAATPSAISGSRISQPVSATSDTRDDAH